MSAAPKKPSLRRGTDKDGPTFCWHCNKQLQRVGGVTGHYFFLLIEEKKAGTRHRIHGGCLPVMKLQRGDDFDNEIRVIPKPKRGC